MNPVIGLDVAKEESQIVQKTSFTDNDQRCGLRCTGGRHRRTNYAGNSLFEIS
ncbi:hypothetical protein SAMN05216352_12915 [Alteribacillus bidgolensis]|uniref:Uncharacterized protein n=1 Tax=Alteribacillus bidgolensis TaxID=930129 RepID=A0A1G8RLV2_9BACI|nr:hypothetical protein SAMN05216352_12915 [Alteribacillus bidgolensis]